MPTGVYKRNRSLLGRTHCSYGHELSIDNLYINKTTGCRVCRKCKQRQDILYRKNNPDRVAATQSESKRRWHLKNTTEHRRREKQWRDANPEKQRAKERRRRALRSGVAGDHYTAEQWQCLKSIYGFRCLCCNRTEEQLNFVGLVLVADHIVSLSQGGSDSISNIQPLCNGKDGCNNRKGVKYADYRRGTEVHSGMDPVWR